MTDLKKRSGREQLDWLKTKEGKDWLANASVLERCERQAALLHDHSPEADEEYNIIEAAIRGISVAEYLAEKEA